MQVVDRCGCEDGMQPHTMITCRAKKLTFCQSFLLVAIKVHQAIKSTFTCKTSTGVVYCCIYTVVVSSHISSL